MPLYTYAYTDQDDHLSPGEDRETVDLFQHIREDAYTTHPENGRPIRRVPQLARAHTKYGEGNGCRPIEMMSIALDNEDEIAAFRQRNPGVEISSRRSDPLFGVPIATSRSEKLRILDREGFIETN